jgi:hypothetical protein
MKRLLTILCLPALLLCALAACAAPQLVQDEASMYLKGECLKKFLAWGPYGYQQRVQFSISHVAFALGETEDDAIGNQVCAAVDATSVGVSDPDQLAAIAIARCNEFASSITSHEVNCKLFAVNNKIVWGKEEDVEFK